jgi:uncharacterized membrane protein YGL010W
MNAYFRRQLADYVEYHRDPLNCLAHVFGILVLFLGTTLPLSIVPIPGLSIPGLGGYGNLATLMALPVLVYWLLLDVGLGLGILVVAALLLSTAGMIVAHATIPGIWSLTAILVVTGVAAQIVGHRVFEQRQPALVDNPAHFLLGPMFVMAKLFIALGFRHDLAAIIGPAEVPTPRPASSGASDR